MSAIAASNCQNSLPNSVIWLAAGMIAVFAVSAQAQFCTIDDAISRDLAEAISCISQSGDPSLCDPNDRDLLRKVGIPMGEIALFTTGWWVSGFTCRDGQLRAVVRLPNGWFGSRFVVYPEHIAIDYDWNQLPLFRH